MKKLLPRIILGTFLVSGCIAYAGEGSVSRRLGDAAFYAGDYRNAISSYESAMAGALQDDRQDEWADCALNLGAAYLRSGQPDKARQLLTEFRRRHPLRSTGTLEGDLLAAEGKTEEAERFYKNLRTADPVMEDARLFSLATLYMNTGRPAEAYELFIRIAGRIGEQWHGEETGALREAMLAGQAVEVCRIAGRLTARPDSPWRRYAVREAVYALIRLKRFDEAKSILNNLPENWRDTDTEMLAYLAAVYEGNIDSLKSGFTVFLEKLPQYPNLRLLELFSQAAGVAGNKRDHQFAAALLTQAVKFAADEALKQELHRQLLIRLMDFDSDKAVTAAEDYCRNHPQADDRLMVVFNTAGQLYNKEAYRQALKLYVFLADNTAGSKGEVAALRLEAAANAVVCSEKLKDFEALEKFSRLLIQESEQSSLWQCRYAAFLESNGRVEAAGKELSDAYTRAKNNKRAAEAEKTAFLLLGFYTRHNDPVKIREYAQLLNNSKVPEYAAAAKMELGQLLENAMLFRQARQYFQEAAALSGTEYAVAAAFKAAMMAYKDSNFSASETAAEFLAFALRYPEYEKSPEALFVAVELFDLAGEAENSARAAALLREKYAGNRAFAVLVLRQAAKFQGEAADVDGLLADLRKVEENFAGTAYAGEAVLLRAVFTDQAGKSLEALQLLTALHDHKEKMLAMESLIRTGEILFRMGRLPEAKAAFLRAAAFDSGILQSDIAMLRAGDCDLAGKAPLDLEIVTGCIANFARLAAESRFLPIRLEASYKHGVALEHAGKSDEALSSYEKAIYIAVEMRSQHLFPADIWCIRSCEAALRLIVAKEETGALQRGMRLIDQLGRVVADRDAVIRIRENYRKQFTHNR